MQPAVTGYSIAAPSFVFRYMCRTHSLPAADRRIPYGKGKEERRTWKELAKLIKK